MRLVGFQYFLNNGQHESGCFTRAGLRRTDEVFALQDQRNGLLLDGGSDFKIEGVDAVEQVRVESEFRKIQVG